MLLDAYPGNKTIVLVFPFYFYIGWIIVVLPLDFYMGWILLVFSFYLSMRWIDYCVTRLTIFSIRRLNAKLPRNFVSIKIFPSGCWTPILYFSFKAAPSSLLLHELMLFLFHWSQFCLVCLSNHQFYLVQFCRMVLNGARYVHCNLGWIFDEADLHVSMIYSILNETRLCYCKILQG